MADLTAATTAALHQNEIPMQCLRAFEVYALVCSDEKPGVQFRVQLLDSMITALKWRNKRFDCGERDDRLDKLFNQMRSEARGLLVGES